MSEKKKGLAGLEKDLAAGVLLAVVICTIGFFVSAHFVTISRDATQLVNEGKGLFAPGRLLHDRAVAGMVASFLALLGIGGLYVFRRRLPNMVVMMAVFVLLAIVVVAFAANTYSTYRSVI